MNKQEIINHLASNNGLSNMAAENAVNLVFDTIRNTLQRGEDVRISGFGVFKRTETKARTCRNPHTGAAVEVPAGYRVKFRPSSRLLGA